MQNEGLEFFFGEPPLFVRKLTRENVELAFDALVKEPRWFDVYGALQVGDR